MGYSEEEPAAERREVVGGTRPTLAGKIGLSGTGPFLGGIEIERQRAVDVFDAFLAQ